MRTTFHPLIDAFRFQARACASLGSPFMDRLCTHFASTLTPGTPLSNRLFGWQGDLGPRGHSVPLRLCGALHALRLKERAGLAAIYPPHQPDDTTFAAAIDAALASEVAFIEDWITSPPQTNEVRRSAALIPAAHWLHARHPLPFRLSELGASGGLNLGFSRFALRIGAKTFGPTSPALSLSPDWSGPLPPPVPPTIAERRGVDLNPLDPQDPADQLRLRAYLWPDQPHRMALTDAAIQSAGPAPDRGDAIDWLSARLGHRPGQLHMIYSTIAWQYFPADRQELGTRLIEQAGQSATPQSPLAWYQMENDGGDGAALTLRLWPGDLTLAMGRADFHGRWIHWSAPE